MTWFFIALGFVLIVCSIKIPEQDGQQSLVAAFLLLLGVVLIFLCSPIGP